MKKKKKPGTHGGGEEWVKYSASRLCSFPEMRLRVSGELQMHLPYDVGSGDATGNIWHQRFLPKNEANQMEGAKRTLCLNDCHEHGTGTDATPRHLETMNYGV